MAVCAVELYVTNILGNSPVAVNNYTSSFIDGRIRILSGEQVNLIVEGVIGIESDAVPPVYLRQATSDPRHLRLLQDRAPGPQH